MHEEAYVLPAEAAAAINAAHDSGHRVVCVGTTTVRVLETCQIPGTRHVAAGCGKTSIFLYPPYKVKIPDALLTNFHLPQSTMLMCVAAFGGYDKVMNAYKVALEEGYRFGPYGDALLIL